MNIDIRAEERTIGRKSDLNNMRLEGYIPGIVYSAGKPSIPIRLDKTLFLKEYRKTIGELVLFNINIAGKEHLTIIKEKQIHPVTREILHIDFQEFSGDKKITVNLPLKFTGTPVGVKNGGIMDVILREVEVSCLADDLIEDVELDVSHLDIGDSIHIADLNLDKLDILVSGDVTILIVHPPKSLVEEEEEDKEAEDTGQEEETKADE